MRPRGGRPTRSATRPRTDGIHRNPDSRTGRERGVGVIGPPAPPPLKSRWPVRCAALGPVILPPPAPGEIPDHFYECRPWGLTHPPRRSEGRVTKSARQGGYGRRPPIRLVGDDPPRRTDVGRPGRGRRPARRSRPARSRPAGRGGADLLRHDPAGRAADRVRRRHVHGAGRPAVRPVGPTRPSSRSPSTSTAPAGRRSGRPTGGQGVRRPAAEGGHRRGQLARRVGRVLGRRPGRGAGGDPLAGRSAASVCPRCMPTGPGSRGRRAGRSPWYPAGSGRRRRPRSHHTGRPGGRNSRPGSTTTTGSS